MAKKGTALSGKQAAFVREYLIDLNATQAAIRAGYSAKTAGAVGHELLKKPDIANALAIAQEARAKRTEIDADWVLRRLASEAGADMAALYDEHGNIKSVHDWPMVFRTGLVTGIETVQERDGTDAEGNPVYVTVKKVKLLDRTKTVELIGKHVTVGAFRERIEIEDITDRAAQMRARRERRLAGKA